MRILLSIVVAALLAAAAAWVIAGRMPAPAITIHQPEKFVGQAGTLDVTVQSPAGALSHFEAYIEQQGRRMALASSTNDAGLQVTQEAGDRIRIRRELGRRSVPDLRPGEGRITVIAGRDVLYGTRTLEGRATRDVRLRFDPPRISVASTHHFVNHGGAEFVVYRVTPADVVSGARVGNAEYRGRPASAAAALAGAQLADPALRVAFFALLHDQDLNTPISLFARDEAGNSARADFEHRPFPRNFRRSNITLTDAFLERVVPAILERTPDLNPQGSTLDKFLVINRELRRKNSEQIAALASQTADAPLFTGPFQQLANSQVEASFADHRTYFYQGKEVDRQVHLGFDLATTANSPIVAANRGKVVFADFLGIYGNTVVIDHGLGLQSLYAHLSSFETAVGQTVEKGQSIGRSGMTGLAGGDHLHFTMIVEGRMVSPVEFWDPHWLEDRVLRKLREAGGAGSM
ncbi:MAG TPA: M23 family metallopeptidase [Vicinamibacterales bacterium]|nr:M23 family metallopeptidase [Vicinamibacterales bacterium]